MQGRMLNKSQSIADFPSFKLGTTPAAANMTIKHQLDIFSMPAFSPVVVCHPAQIRIDFPEETGKQPGVCCHTLSRSLVSGRAALNLRVRQDGHTHHQQNSL